MKVTIDEHSRRLMVWPETPEDFELVVMKMELKRVNANVPFQIEDTVFHRIMLGVTLDNGYVGERLPLGHIRKSSKGEELRQYQINDIKQMAEKRFNLNRNQMGLGKTVEGVQYARALQLERILIICPKPVQKQWVKEFKNWWARRKDDISIYKGGRKPLSKITIVNFEKLRIVKYKKGDPRSKLLPSSPTLELFKSRTWDLIIIDEGHRLKNRESLTFIGINSLPAMRRLALTGTPIMRYPDDLFALLKWLHPWYSGGSYHTFVKYFCRKESNPFGSRIVGLTKDVFFQDVLRKTLEYIGVYNSREEVLKEVPAKLPPQYIQLEMDPDQKKLYQQIHKLMIDELAEEGIDIANGMAKTIKLRQVTSNPGLLSDKLKDKNKNPKLCFIRDMLEDHPDLQLVIYSWYAETLKTTEQALKEWGISTATYFGEVAQGLRDKALQRFISGEARVMLGTIGALGTGVDGMQYASSVEVFMERDWNPEPNNQAEDRLCRYGQEDVVKVYVLQAEKSVDIYVGRVNTNKLEDIEKILYHKPLDDDEEFEEEEDETC